MTVTKGYAGELPLLYDHIPLYKARRDVAFYLDLAGESKGPVLEVGCGSGRILLPIARKGIQIDGLDSSPAMLQRCATKLGDETAETRALVTLHEGTATEFNLGKRYGLITAPFRVLQHLLWLDEQLAFFATASRHLAPGARLAFDVFNPNFAALVAADGIEHEDTPPTPLPDGRVFRRTGRVKRVRKVDQVSEIELTYYLVNENAEDTRLFVHAFDMRWYLRNELVLLVERAGFQIENVFGDFDNSPLSDDSPEIIVVAMRK